MTGPYLWAVQAEGRAECEVQGVMPAAFLNRCAAAGIPILAALPVGGDTLLVSLRQRDLRKAQALAARSQCELRLLHSRGGSLMGRRLLRRLLPAFCLLAAFALLICSKLFVWELEVTGNETVSSPHILNALQDCGVGPGCFWPAFTSDNLRSELLVQLPELAWATVNIHGSRAEVVVRERVKKPELFDAGAPTDLVASRVGFVTELRVLNGTAKVRPGSAAAPGDILISGEANSAFSGRRLLHALGTVQAETYRELTASAPATELVRSDESVIFTRWALLLGKKRYNIFGNSSICGAECDKIRTTWECKKEGLFYLPIGLVREQCSSYTLQERPVDAAAVRRALEQTLYERLLASLDEDAVIESTKYSCCEADGCIVVCLRARCSENIAVERQRTQEEAVT